MNLKFILLLSLGGAQAALPAAREASRMYSRLVGVSGVRQIKSMMPTVTLRLGDQSNSCSYTALVGLGLATAIASNIVCNDSEMVKPDWAVKHIPNGVPKELDDQIKFMQNPHYFTRLGAILPKGILLYGPPGTGKTSIARAVADELGVTFISVSSTDLTAHLYGKGSEKVRALFKDARTEAQRSKNKTVVMFIDELDLIAPNRNSPTGRRAYGEQITTLLTEIDGFFKDPEITVYIIAATNRKDVIDPAILRSGRLESHVLISAPTLEGRVDILRHYLKGVMYRGTDIVVDLAIKTEGMSGADLRSLVNDAAILAGSEQANKITEAHLIRALDNKKRPNVTSKSVDHQSNISDGARI